MPSLLDILRVSSSGLPSRDRRALARHCPRGPDPNFPLMPSPSPTLAEPPGPRSIPATSLEATATEIRQTWPGPSRHSVQWEADIYTGNHTQPPETVAATLASHGERDTGGGGAQMPRREVGRQWRMSGRQSGQEAWIPSVSKSDASGTREEMV